MLIVYFYLAIGAVLAVLYQFTSLKSDADAFDRVLSFLLVTAIWPIEVAQDWRTLFGLNRRELKQRRDELALLDALPPLHGGDGLTAECPVIVNCSSMSMANHLMDGFIAERHGAKDVAWKRGIEMTLGSDKTRCGMVRAIAVVLADGSETTYFFDCSRPVGVALTMMGEPSTGR